MPKYTSYAEGPANPNAPEPSSMMGKGIVRALKQAMNPAASVGGVPGMISKVLAPQAQGGGSNRGFGSVIRKVAESAAFQPTKQTSSASRTPMKKGALEVVKVFSPQTRQRKEEEKPIVTGKLDGMKKGGAVKKKTMVKAKAKPVMKAKARKK